MTSSNLKALVAIVIGLLLLLVVLDNNVDRDDAGRALLPGFKAHADDVTDIRIIAPGGQEPVTLRRESDRFVVTTRDGYPADIARLRALVIALADARVLEDKTSNPEQYSKLAVDDPEKGGSGSRIDVTGSDFTYSVILGNQAQNKYRYARVANEPESYLIDRDPSVPPGSGEWLAPSILDIAADDIERVSISHADGETLVIEKSARELTDFAVIGVPDGRELSYATVGNGIAAALDDLELRDVRMRLAASVATTAVFETWDGITITAEVLADGDTSWVGFGAQSRPIDAAESDSNEVAAAGEASAADDAARTVRQINEHVSRWQYQIPDFKKNLLTRRWDDILKTATAE